MTRSATRAAVRWKPEFGTQKYACPAIEMGANLEWDFVVRRTTVVLDTISKFINLCWCNVYVFYDHAKELVNQLRVQDANLAPRCMNTIVACLPNESTHFC